MEETKIELMEGQIIKGLLFNEPMQIVTLEQKGRDTWVLGLVGQQTEKFRNVTLTTKDINGLEISEKGYSYKGNGELLRLGMQAYSLGIAFEFDPYFGLSISRVDPLPHQLEAVYEYLLKLVRVRFLLADDAGAGKTIMAGLLLKELKLRGLIERILILCPSNLAFQWQRELTDKFDERFHRIKTGSDIEGDYGLNPWLENKQIVVSMDLVRYQHFWPALRQCNWDFVIVDEAHRMSAASEDKKTLRYKLGELLRERTDHLLLLTATPHKGDPLNFSLFLRLLDADAYADVRSIHEAMEQRRAPFYLRRTKEAMVYFPERRLLVFTEFKDTLDYLVSRLKEWGFRVGHIHGGMKPGSRTVPGTRLYSEQQFKEGAIQILVATEAAGEGINLQCCHILFNYDIPWNPNRLEQRMGRIHRCGQTKACLIFNFVATNTIEGRILQKLLERLQEIRDALAQESLGQGACFYSLAHEERIEEIERISHHVEISLTELIQRADEQIGYFAEEVERGVEGAAGNLKQAEDRHGELMLRHQIRRAELEQQKSLSLQGVERMTSIVILPHPEREKPELQEPIKDPAHLAWHEVKKVSHYYLSVDAISQPMQVREESAPYGDKE